MVLTDGEAQVVAHLALGGMLTTFGSPSQDPLLKDADGRVLRRFSADKRSVLDRLAKAGVLRVEDADGVRTWVLAWVSVGGRPARRTDQDAPPRPTEDEFTAYLTKGA